MKNFSKQLTALFAMLFVFSSSAAGFFDSADTFFGKYVQEGKVLYSDILENRAELDNLFTEAKTMQMEPSSDEHKAYWINMYNLAVIRGVIDEYPISSPQEVSGFFTKKRRIVGEILSLNDIENTILRKEYEDARLHFVLVCGAVDCPPLIARAYRPETLEKQMEMQTKIAINNPFFIKKTSPTSVEVSQIFEWYAEDFGNKKAAILSFINSYRVAKFKRGIDLGYYAYDWALNEKRTVLADDGTAQIDLLPETNIRVFTPSKLLGKGQIDFKVFNNLYTQTRQTDAGSLVRDIPRENFFTTTFELTYGISNNSRLNLGLISTVVNSSRNLGVFRAFDYANSSIDGSTYTRHGMASLGAVIKYTPFKSVGNFSLQSGLLFPTHREINYGYLAFRSIVWDTKFFFDKTVINRDFQLFAQLDLSYAFGENSSEVSDPALNTSERFANESLGIPASVFFSYFLNNALTFYVNGQQFVRVDLGNGFSQEFTQFGVGAKYQVTKALNLEVSHGRFVRGSNFAGLGQTYNLGARILI